MQDSVNLFGIDWDAPLSTDLGEAEQVECPIVPNPLSATDFQELQATINPYDPSDDFGYSLL